MCQCKKEKKKKFGKAKCTPLRTLFPIHSIGESPGRERKKKNQTGRKGVLLEERFASGAKDGN